jgi:hypothetical protein
MTSIRNALADLQNNMIEGIVSFIWLKLDADPSDRTTNLLTYCLEELPQRDIVLDGGIASATPAFS